MYNKDGYTNYLASENQDNSVPEGMKSDEEIVALALEYFPEYSENINSPIQMNALQSRTMGEEDVLVINDTKNISEEEKIVYQEYASGKANIMYIIDENVTLTQNGSGRQMYKSLDIQVYSLVLSGSMYINDFAYTIYYDGYDLINNPGNTTGSGISVNRMSFKSKEDASGPATVVYSGVFPYSYASEFVASCILEITVGDNEYMAVAH